MPITLSCDVVDDGVGRVQLDGSVGDIHGEFGDGMVYDDVGIMWKYGSMVCVLCWELLSLLASA
jgi:hypothetical protein